MKKVILFLGLKVAEISAIVFIPYYTGVGVVAVGLPKDDAPFWLIGFAALLIVSFFTLFIYFVPGAILKSNWEWAGRILKEGK